MHSFNDLSLASSFRFNQTAACLAVAALFTSASYAAETELNPVTVTATRNSQEVRNVVGDVTVLDEAEIRSRAAQNVSDLLRTIPGLQIVNNGGPGKATSVSIRGANINQTVLLIDGMRVGSATSGTPSFQNIPIDQIERIEVLRGAASSLYGADAIGGVIQIFTKSGKGAPKANATVGYGTWNTSLLSTGYQGAVGDKQATSFAINVNHYETDGISSVSNTQSRSFNGDQDGYRNLNFSGKLAHRFNADHDVGLNILSGESMNHYDSTTARYDYRNQDKLATYSAWSNNRLLSWWNSKLQVGYSNDETRSSSPTSNTNLTTVEALFRTTQKQFSWQNDLKLLGGTTTLGLERLEQRISSTSIYPTNQRDVDSVFAGYVASFHDVTVQLNARNDDNSQFGEKTTGYGGLSYDITNAWQIGTSMGTGFRAPTFNELYFPNFGNPNLRPERSRNREVFTRYNANVAGGTLNSGVTIYRNQVTDLILNLGPSSTPINIGQATLKGATLNSDWVGKMWRLGGSFDALSAKDASGGTNNGKLLPRRAQRFASVYAGSAWNAWEWRAEIDMQGHRYDEAANQQRLGAYSILNLSAAYQINKTLTARLRIDNALNKNYELAKDYGVVRQTALLSLSYQGF